MPHIVLAGPLDLQTFWQAYAPFTDRSPAAAVLKVGECWFNNYKTALLVDCVVVERGLSRRFRIAVNAKGDRTTVQLEATSMPPASDGVLAMLVRVAAELRRVTPGLSVATHDLPPAVAATLEPSA